MAIIGNKFTILDAAKRLDPNGQYAQIAEVLNKSNPILQDMPFFPSNAPRGNRVTFRTGLPQVSWGELNKGVHASKSQVTSREDTIGVLEGRNEIDRRHKGRSMSPEAYLAYRWDEDQTFLESMGQKMAQTLVDGSELDEAAAFTGFLPRLSDTSDAIFGRSITKAFNGFDAGTQAYEIGGGTAYTPMYDSILIVDWGKRYNHGIYPYNTPAGLTQENHENELILDASGGKYYVDASVFSWSLGLTVRHPKHVHAIRNILRHECQGTIGGTAAQTVVGMDSLESDMESRKILKSGSAANVAFGDIIGCLIKALSRMDPCTDGHRVIYCSKTMETILEYMAKNTHNMMLNYSEWAGQPVTTFRGIPIRGVDYLDENIDAGT